MKKAIIFSLAFILTFAIVFVFFSDHTKMLVDLRDNGDRIYAQINAIENSPRSDVYFVLTISFKYEDKRHKERITVRNNSTNKYLSEYQIWKRIRILIDGEKWIIRSANAINSAK